MTNAGDTRSDSETANAANTNAISTNSANHIAVKSSTHAASAANWSLMVMAFVLLSFLIGATLWIAGDVLLLIFTGLLFALLLVNLSRAVERKTKFSYLWSLAIVVGALATALGLLTTLFATRFASEATGLFETVQSKWQDLSAQVQKYLGLPNWMAHHP